MAKSSRKILLACLTLLLCVALLVGGAYALFSADVPVENHLVAGNLSATLVRDRLVWVTLDDKGKLVSDEDPDDKDFSKAGSENLFGLKNDAKIAPGCSFTADMVLGNNGSVAFTYWIEIKLKGDSNELAEQLKVTVTSGGTKSEQPLNSGLEVGKADGLGVVEVGGQAKFSVSVEFTDRADNNDAQEQEANFDLVVHATQDATVH